MTGRVIDMLRPTWGHNLETVSNDGNGHLRFAVWLTPEPRVGDRMKYEVQHGVNIVRIDNVKWTGNVDDMYFIDTTVVERIPKDVQ